MLRSYRLFSVAGVPVRVSGTLPWILVFALLVHGTGGGPGPFLATVALCLVFVVSLFLHELGHAAAAWRLGLPVVDITLYWFGGIARIGKAALAPREELRVALAGPLANLALAALLAPLLLVVSGAPGRFLAMAVLFNVGLGGLNLLPGWVPGIPLDGGRVLRAWLRRRLPPSRAAATAADVASWTALGLVAVATLVLESWILFLFAAVLLVGAWVEKARARWVGPLEDLGESSAGWTSLEELLRRGRFGEHGSGSPHESGGMGPVEDADTSRQEPAGASGEDDDPAGRIIELQPDGTVRRVVRGGGRDRSSGAT